MATAKHSPTRARPRRPNRESQALRDKAIDSLILAVELFNRPSDRGRRCGVLIWLDHAFEMLMKAALIYRGHPIRVKGQPKTFSSETCLRRILDQGDLRFITEDQANLLRALNTLRDGEQHHYVEVAEESLYLLAQGSFSAFRAIYREVFEDDLRSHLPERVLPISTMPPEDLESVFQHEVEAVRKLLQPGTRRRYQALARLKSLAIIEGALEGEVDPPTDYALGKLAEEVRANRAFEDMFPGVAALEITATGTGPSLDLQIVKKGGMPVSFSNEILDEEGPTPVLAIRRVNELGFYCFGRNDLADKTGLSQPRTSAVIWHLNLKSDDTCFKQIPIGKSTHERYSQAALARIREAIDADDLDEIWRRYQLRRKHADR